MIYSSSKIESYIKCPHSYQKQYISKVPLLPNSYMAQGSFLHAVLERFHQNLRPEESSMASVMAEAYKFVKEQFHKKDRIIFSLSNAKLILQNYIYFLGKGSKPIVAKNDKNELLLEKKFQIEIAGSNFKGIIDRVDQLSKNEFLIIDYKSSKGNSYLSKSFQPFIYYYAAKELLGADKKIAFAYLLLGIPKFQKKEVEGQLESKTKELQNIIKQIEGDKVFERKWTRGCFYCGYYNDCKKFFHEVL